MDCSSMKYEPPRPGQAPRIDKLTNEIPVLGVQEALGLTSGHLDNLEMLVNEVYQRLTPILGPSAPEKGEVYCQAQTDSEVAAIIVSLSGRIRGLSSCLIELKSRLRL